MNAKSVKRVVLSSLTACMGAALVGSVTGAIAWYSYATRETVSFSGMAAKTTGQLQLGYEYLTEAKDAQGNPVTTDGAALADDKSNQKYVKVLKWLDVGKGLTNEDVKTIIMSRRLNNGKLERDAANDLPTDKLAPVTSGKNDGKTAPSMKAQPVEGYTQLNAAELDQWVNFTIKARIVDYNGEEVPYVAPEVSSGVEDQTIAEGHVFETKTYNSWYNGYIYMSDIFAAEAVTNTHEDISNALRLYVEGQPAESVKDYIYVATTDTVAVADKTYYKDANGTALEAQPEAASDISDKNYFEKVAKNTSALVAPKSAAGTSTVVEGFLDLDKDSKLDYRYVKYPTLNDFNAHTNGTVFEENNYAFMYTYINDPRNPALPVAPATMAEGKNVWDYYDSSKPIVVEEKLIYGCDATTTHTYKTGTGNDRDEIVDSELEKQVSLVHNDVLAAFDTDGYLVESDTKLALGMTNGSKGLDINMQIWIEGWDKLGGTTAMWDATDFVNASFNLGITFQCDRVERLGAPVTAA